MFSQPGATTIDPVKLTGLTPTSEQAAIIDAARTGTDLVVTAGAGTGKTSTLKMLSRPRSLYLAYNRAIADDARTTFPATTHAATAHSLAYRAVMNDGLKARLNGARQRAQDTARILELPLVVSVGHFNLTSVKVARLVADMLARFCQSHDQHIGARHLPFVPGISEDENATADLLDIALPAATRAWEDITSPAGKLRFTHDHYLKMWALTEPVLPYDLVMLDEAQDANPVIAHVVEQQTAQKVLVGDSSQAIYGWRGAIDAMASFNGARLTLSQSWRFGQVVADIANDFLDMLDAPLRLTGNPNRSSRLARLPHADAILCRTNAGALAHVITAQAEGKPVALVGGGNDIRMLAEAARDLQAGRPAFHPELIAFSSWGEVRDYAEHDSGGSDLKVFVKLIDTLGVPRVLAAIAALVDEYNAAVVVSTAHKAKGREWETVRLAGDFPPVHDKDGDLLEAEAMLTYVAVTRAKEVLDHSALPSYGYSAGPAAVLPEALALDNAVTHSQTGTFPGPWPQTDQAPALPYVELDHVGAQLYAAYLSLDDQIKVLTEQQNRVEEQLQARMGDATEARIGGVTVISWKWSKPGAGFDKKALEKDHPDIYAKYVRENKPGRPFKPVKG